MSRTIKKDKSQGEALLDNLMETYKSRKDKRTYSKIRKKGYKSNEFKGRASKISSPSK